jgi:hypothetical protein
MTIAMVLAVVLLAAQTTPVVRVALTNGLELYQDAEAAAARRVVMRVVDTKTGLDALAYRAQDAESALWSGTPPAVNAAKQTAAFGVTYAATSRRDADDVVVACERIMKVSTIRCVETPLPRWRRAFPGATRRQILERAAADPGKVRP